MAESSLYLGAAGFGPGDARQSFQPRLRGKTAARDGQTDYGSMAVGERTATHTFLWKIV